MFHICIVNRYRLCVALCRFSAMCDRKSQVRYRRRTYCVVSQRCAIGSLRFAIDAVLCCFSAMCDRKPQVCYRRRTYCVVSQRCAIGSLRFAIDAVLCCFSAMCDRKPQVRYRRRTVLFLSDVRSKVSGSQQEPSAQTAEIEPRPEQRW